MSLVVVPRVQGYCQEVRLPLAAQSPKCMLEANDSAEGFGAHPDRCAERSAQMPWTAIGAAGEFRHGNIAPAGGNRLQNMVDDGVAGPRLESSGEVPFQDVQTRPDAADLGHLLGDAEIGLAVAIQVLTIMLMDE